jgi:hypothetical protein
MEEQPPAEISMITKRAGDRIAVITIFNCHRKYMPPVSDFILK